MDNQYNKKIEFGNMSLHTLAMLLLDNLDNEKIASQVRNYVNIYRGDKEIFDNLLKEYSRIRS
jgi:hypothetical protein